ncbi:hypothetical protein TEPIDINF_000584 [Tepidibacillus infernus]|uniref:Uncharacterized protein n=2 Tax=Tepidibacillus TaxID=1494427 RepID=A0A135L2M5_9BACI|nr:MULTISPECIES: hypothetical protein [Tepidibacillus]KXG43231.1 hypothetical protein U473_03780 [Tepidibacillus decaturensis]TCS83965.1 hypothetical protein EDD72_1023 [Tepidibacillus fermentans]
MIGNVTFQILSFAGLILPLILLILMVGIYRLVVKQHKEFLRIDERNLAFQEQQIEAIRKIQQKLSDINR